MVKYGFVWRRFNWGAGQYRSINKAIRTSSSVTGALVYFPPGKYQVSSSIVAMYNSQLVGDTTDLPTIRAASSLLAWVGDGAEWYINENNFFRQARNFIIDIR
ncbi:uncharacterized protein NFIA_049810 [Aspergillus fischeri NRRL 181]|uniref:Rhamnogalacturonase A/B/Epimerase-like pectate lyase domain-containing protein n=1 Tax=Neosartorya fischeri (strain ATCC 1020 / DSM 3700 / CBS 544.65 / FGSC A1164 / JCM 1740 / NRRL 181 / WB 181) TaxID=331117 RepID=A1DLG9_NEOFI|nr:uncharacterized protein NFIA_049810 [Aspergillus fischeri NRRL 181]EAW15640.1 hypothetical protein NFIA_049810 [Aspergillus fischeri NRRL 181]